MDGLGLITVATSNVASCCCRSGSLTTTSNRFLFFPSLNFTAVSRLRLRRSVSFARRRKFTVFATRDDSQFDEWELMELKFGRLLGEDPKLTLAKILTRRTNPDATFMEIEKEFYKNKGKMPERKEVPFNVDKRSSISSSVDGLNLVRPVPKKGVRFQTDDKPILPQVRKPKGQNAKVVVDRSSVPNVILRKPTVFNEDDIEDERTKLKMKPNLTIKMRDEQMNDKFSDMTLLRKPEPKMEDIDEKDGADKDVDTKSVSESYRLNVKKSEEKGKYSDFPILNKPEVMNVEQMSEPSRPEYTTNSGQEKDSVISEAKKSAEKEKYSDFPILNKPEVMNVEQMSEPSRPENTTNSGQEQDSVIGLQPPVPRNMKSFKEETSINETKYSSFVDSTPKFEASLIGKPKRLDQSVIVSSSSSVAEKLPITSLEIDRSSEVENIGATSPSEDFDWDKAQELANKGERGEVELISSSTKGFMVSFGSLVGFLPYRNLASKWKFLAFETWLRRKGLDPSMYRQNLGIIGNNDLGNKNSLRDSSLDPVIEQKLDGQISPDMKLEDLLRIYDQEKLKFLQSFVGQKLNVIVITADKNSKKLIFSMRPKEKDELVEKKKSLMAKLRVGDVIKCCIQKITYFGIFVEIEGVPALIHQTEVSWDATLDPSSYFKVGQTVEAKVHQLDFSLGRIFLSMKEITPDPLIESLESVVGGRDPLDGKLQIAEPDSEWPDVESLIKELEKIEGIQSVSKGSFFLSPGLAPTFQVYMTPTFENQYKLLARSENKVQEVIVESSLSKEEMKSTILSCASRVE